MKYHLDEVTSRRGSNSYKWDSNGNPSLLPMWVADMDFRVAPAIQRALEQRVAHGIFGYVRVPDAYYEAVVNWFERKHGWTMNPKHIIYTSGVVPAVSAIIKALTMPGDKVLVQTPVYNCFFSSIINNGCQIEPSPLVRKGNSYCIDFEDLEKKASQPSVKVLLLCNPHNPAGRVWTKEELMRIGEICLRNHVFVIADEIHCELVSPGHTYTPFASLSEAFLQNSATCTSPSKAFNIAGLQIANITVADPEIYRRVDRAININEVCDVNPFGVVALMAAYNESEDWLEEVKAYIYENYLYMKQFCEQYLPRFVPVSLEGTYLAWMDCSALSADSEALQEKLIQEAGLWLSDGRAYGLAGEGYMRWNLACPRSLLMEGLNRFRTYVQSQNASLVNAQEQ